MTISNTNWTVRLVSKEKCSFHYNTVQGNKCTIMYTSCSQRRFKAKLMYVRILILKQHFDSSVAYPTGTVPELKQKLKHVKILIKTFT